MRSKLGWFALSSAVLLSACGGDTAPQTVGSVAPPSGGGSSPSPSPAPAHSFIAPTEVKTYEAIGSVQHYEYYTQSNGSGQGGQLYAGDANTVRSSGITVTYNPRDAIFDLTINRPAGIVTVANFRFQDPVHRIDFGGAREPQAGVPDLNSAASGGDHRVQYLQAGSSSGVPLSPLDPYYTAGLTAANSDLPVGSKGYTSQVSTYFYQKNTATAGTKYVTYAGFVRNSVTATEEQPDPASPAYLRQNYAFDRAAFAYGERTPNAGVPTSGTGTYSGEMIATMVFNNTLDDPALNYPSYLQWIQGTHTTQIDFGSLAVSSLFTGRVGDVARDAYTSGNHVMLSGSTFSAYSTARIDLVNKGGFTGQFGCATFNGTCSATGGTGTLVNIAGSSIDGAFFGPNGQEIGGGFRIVGGTPDERIDILGTFTGAKP